MPDEKDSADDFDIATFRKRMGVSWSDVAPGEIATGLRWPILQAIAFIATGSSDLVAKVWEWCPRGLALTHYNQAQFASIELTRELEQQRFTNPHVLQFTEALRRLLTALGDGKITAYVNAKPTLLTGMAFREITYSNAKVGLSPPPLGDTRCWNDIDLNSEDVRSFRSASMAGSPQPTISEQTGAKRGPKPKWDWLKLMGELVRIADMDGLDHLGSQADVERWARDWLMENHNADSPPSESLIREHIAPVFKAIDVENTRRRG